MTIALYIIFIGVPLYFAFSGHKKGFLKTLVSMLALIVSVVFIAFFGGSIGKLVDENTELRQTVQENIYNKLDEKVTEAHAETDEEQREAIAGTFIPAGLLDLFDKKENPFGAPMDDYVTRVSVNMADTVINICGVIITIVISLIITGVLLKLSGLVSKMPLLGSVNKLLGGALGLAYGVLIVLFICLVITLISGTELGMSIMESITGSKLLSFIYDGAIGIETWLLGL